MKQTYENAFARLETIVAQIEKGETDLDALAKGVDYQEWMKIEQLRGFNNSNNNHVHGHSIINGSSRLVSGRGARVH